MKAIALNERCGGSNDYKGSHARVRIERGESKEHGESNGNDERTGEIDSFSALASRGVPKTPSRAAEAGGVKSGSSAAFFKNVLPDFAQCLSCLVRTSPLKLSV